MAKGSGGPSMKNSSTTAKGTKITTGGAHTVRLGSDKRVKGGKRG